MNKEEIKELFDKYGVRQPIEKNGQSECKICKEKHRYSLTWTSFLYEYEGHYYCQEDLLIVLLNKEHKKEHKALLDIKEYIEKSFDNQNFEIRKTYEDDEVIGIGYYFNGNDILDIVNKAIGGKDER